MAKHVSAGELRHLIAIQHKATVQDDTGDIVEAWADLFPKVYASVEPLSAKDFIAAQATEAKVSVRITIRYRAGVTSEMRVVHRGIVYQIEGVLPDLESGREYLTLPCSVVA